MSFSGSSEKAGDRILPRHSFEARIKIEVERESRYVVVEGWARDLSESGIGAFVAAELVIGEQATLRIPLSNEIELAIPAVVMRTLGTQYGFRFTALSKTQREQLRNALAVRPAVSYIPAIE